MFSYEKHLYRSGEARYTRASNPLENPRSALSHAHTHRDHAVALVVAAQGVDDGGGADGLHWVDA
jgi:hypothetical protein